MHLVLHPHLIRYLYVFEMLAALVRGMRSKLDSARAATHPKPSQDVHGLQVPLLPERVPRPFQVPAPEENRNTKQHLRRAIMVGSNSK